ncbi:multidrug resistance-associated protein 1-like [Mercenaria mercenaria]|uniref:multidrug resistance-associated protein 1-like n=1 Tax=Mercenaria mercenaria TaxID=6596 RepID=UPI00234E6F15|nr:multidrug resistance-associated protein 1-like [Mercenaria mercenaria]
MLPIVGYLATQQFKLQKDMLYLKGRRIKILNEVISGIKVLKMYAWELSFMKKIQNIRNEELDRLMRYARLTTITVVFAIHSPFMILFTLVLIHVLMSPTHTLRAEETFTAISIINIIKFPITICPFLVNGCVQASVSIRRITEFLCQDDLELNVTREIEKSGKHVVSVKDGTFTWDRDSPFATLIGINLKVNKGELVAVVGPVGSGKSSLLASCMGEMETIAGDVSLKGSVAYVPQEAWIQNMTLRDNILFGRDYQESKYRRVIDACALLPDLQILAGGDMTEIGEKGINISGGQKQRVNLARSVYNNADIYFLDDPLSAVDSHVGKHLFQKVIGKDGLLKNKTRILVTHGIHWLPMVDRIIVMKDGRISESGTYSDLINMGGAFAEFIENYLQECNDDEDEDPEIIQMRQQIQAEIELKSDGGITSEEEGRSQSGHKRLKRSVKNSIQISGRSVIKRASTDIRKKEVGQDTTRLTGDETSEEGAIKPTVLLHFMRAMGLPAVITVLVTMTIFQGLNVYSNFWLTFWTENTLLLNTSLAGTRDYEDTYLFYLLGFALQGILQGIFVYISFYLALTRMVRASGKLHDSMLKSILHSPMAFFDTTPIGRIMNRFSSDVDIMDNKLPDSFRLWQTMIFSTIAIVAVVTISTPIFIAVLLPIIIIYVFFVPKTGCKFFIFQRFYLPTARQMRRIESVKRSPIYNHFSETITGASVIRAYRSSDRFVRESRERIDENIKFYYAATTGARWVGWRLEVMGNLVAFLAAVFALISYDLNGAQVGMSVTYAVQLTITLNFGVFAISEMEMNIISAERVTEYTTLPAEANWETDSSAQHAPQWPKFGRIEFRGYKTRYRPGLELVLQGIHCTIREGEKVGIVGRTGAGKSSLALALFRLIESADGAIVIDGVDISTLGLHELRKKLTILPQDPVLFSGSLRNNLDPFNHYDDESLWFAIECAHLKDFVMGQETLLDFECGESGQNLSVGQRQLVCLARTLLHKTKILILDEATAAVDMETDDLIQETIRKQFNDCTILAVAHRLSTVMDYDRLMVLDKGKLAEFDSPAALLQNTDSIFHGMAKDAGLV